MGSMAGLRRGAAQLNNSGKGGSKRNSYFARWKPPQMTADILRFLTPDETRGTQIAEPIIFIPSEYVDVYQTVDESGQPLPGPVLQPAFRFKSHTIPTTIQAKGRAAFQKFVDLVCSAGLEAHAPQPCLGCYSVDHGEEVSARDQWAFDIAHLGWYHEMPLVKDNQIQMKKDGKGPVMIKNECQNYRVLNQSFQRMDTQSRGQPQARECEGCKQQAKFVWGDHRFLQVGKNQLENILAFNDELGKTCANCGTGIVTMAYDCSKCQTEILNVASSGWTNDQIETFSKTLMQCRTCGTVDRPRPAYECGFDTRSMQQVAGGCPQEVDPRPLDIFDVVVWMQREGESTSSKIVIKSWTTISNFRMPDGRGSGTEDGRPLVDAMKDIVPRPFDLKAMHSPLNLEDQAKSVRRENPFRAGPQYQAYGGAQPPQQGGYPPPQNAQPPAGYYPPGAAPAPPQAPQQGWAPPVAPNQPQWQQPSQQQAPAMYPPGSRPNFGK